jgi:hypothetical protein
MKSSKSRNILHAEENIEDDSKVSFCLVFNGFARPSRKLSMLDYRNLSYDAGGVDIRACCVLLAHISVWTGIGLENSREL